MKHFDFVIIGAGIAGLLTAYRLRKYNTLLVDKNDILSGASGAAGAFLFPKVGLDTKYTRFVNEAIVNAVSFYQNLGIDIHKKGVLILPRDEKDIEKFKNYEKEIKLPYKKTEDGFYFDIGSIVEPQDVKKALEVDFRRENIKKIEKRENFWIINQGIKTKNIIFATGYETIKNFGYIKIRPVWGERIEIKADIGSLPYHYHKNCSLAQTGGIFRIGATHKRNCINCSLNDEEAKFLIEKAKEIKNIENYDIINIKGGFRAASVDYFPVLGKIIDIRRMVLEDRYIIKGDLPKEYFYHEGLFVINGMGGRGFSNAVVCSNALSRYILDGEDLGILDSKRLFIKWVRKEGEKYLENIKEKNAES